MRGLGILATVCAAAAGAGATALVVTSLPDIKRYIRISRM